MKEEEPKVKLVEIHLCELCLGGKGGECHVPGCALFINRAPDLEVGKELYQEVDWNARQRAIQMVEEWKGMSTIDARFDIHRRLNTLLRLLKGEE